MRHELKTDPAVFDAVEAGLMTVNIRKDDRGYRVGDVLCLRKTLYTGAEMAAGKLLHYVDGELDVMVSHILRGPIYGLQEGWVLLSIQRIDIAHRSGENIDRKYTITASNPCSGSIHTEQDSVLFLAKDKAFLEGALPGYRAKCVEFGTNPAHIESIDLLTERIRTYQAKIEAKVPDTDLPCEIRRCVDGEGL